MSTIRNADVIVGLSAGKVVEMGSHEELMDLKGIYFELVTMQTKEARPVEAENVETNEEDEEAEEAEEDKVKTKNDQIEEDLSEDEENLEESGNLTKHKKDLKKRKPFYLQKLMWSYNKNEWFHLTIASLAQLINGGSMPAVALLFSQIYTIFAEKDPKKQEKSSLEFMGYIFGIAGAGFITGIVSNYSFSLASARLTKRLRVLMFRSMLRQEISWYDLDENRSSILATRLSASAPLCKGLTIDILNLISQGISGVGVAVVVSFILNWKLALVMLVFVPISFASGLISARSSLNTNVKGKTVIEEGGKLTTECVENIKTLLGNYKPYVQMDFKNSDSRGHYSPY